MSNSAIDLKWTETPWVPFPDPLTLTNWIVSPESPITRSPEKPAPIPGRRPVAYPLLHRPTRPPRATPHGEARRQVRPAPQARGGRDGRGVGGPRHRPRPSGRGQAPRRDRGRRRPPPISARGGRR